MNRAEPMDAARTVAKVDPRWTTERTERALDRLLQRQRRERAILGAGAASIAIAALVLFALRPSAAPEHPAMGSAVPSGSVLTLADGSTITALGAVQLDVPEASPTRLRVVLTTGDVAVDVVPDRAREFILDAGALRIVVLGTHFTVERVEHGEHVAHGEHAFRVAVQRGHVRATWHEGAPRDLLAGDVVVFTENGVLSEPLSNAPESETHSDEMETEAPEAPVEPTAPSPTLRGRAPMRETMEDATSTASDWHAAAERGEYAAAYASIRALGPTSVRDDVEDLLLAADAARLSGHAADALPFLDRAMREHPDDARSPMAAFTHGRVLLGLGRADDAAHSFERSIELGAEGSLRENALARAVEAHGRAGHGAEANRLARSYLEAYPTGRWLASVRAYGGLDE